MWRAPFLAILLAGSAPALAATTASHDGFGALALAAQVGEHSPVLNAGDKALLSRYLDGEAGAAHAQGQRISVTSGSVTCRASNVDITAYSCDLSFGAAEVTIQGRAAQGLFATLAELGVQSEGAAGTMYEGVTDLDCTIDADEISDTGGGGAHCTFSPA